MSYISNIILILTLIIALLTLINRFAKIYFLLTSMACRTQNCSPSIKAISSRMPFIAIHVAISNEDPKVVLATLSSLNKLDYPNYIVMVIDNNTTDNRFWKPVEEFCLQYPKRFSFHHIDRLAGYKSGALNYALRYTPDNVEFIAIIDADTIVKSNFLRETIPYFNDKKVAIVQTPLGFLNDPKQYNFISWIYLIYRYFLSIYMIATDKFDIAPFIGAMGIVRRSALEQVGGWNGLYLTEDMELSYRLFRQGFTSRFINYSYGCSMPPSDLNNFKKQHYRWNFGNAQILRDYSYNIFTQCLKSKSKLMKQVLYFACPGIYINLYLIPFAIIAALIQFANIVRFPLQFVELSCGIMLGTIIIELIGDTLMFYIIGKSERTPSGIWLKNLISWWGLHVNNARSTFAVLFFKTRPFEITSKANGNNFYRMFYRHIEFGFITVLFSAAFLPLYVSGRLVILPSLVLIILGCLSFTVFLLPIQEKEIE